MSYGFALKGALDVDLLEKSLGKVVQRHESLRTRIVPVNGTVVQEVEPPYLFTFERASVPGRSQDEIESGAQRVFTAFSAVSVDPVSGPLFRAMLLKLGQLEHWLLLAVHRFIADCFSVDQLMPELWTVYADQIQHRPCSLPSNPPQYRDYAIRQQAAHEQWGTRHNSYWQRQLVDARNIEWPADADARGEPQGTLGRMNILFGERLSEQLREFARGRRTLAATVMLAIYVVALCRYCNQRDFVVPCFVAGRESEHKSVVGYFSHILYVRVRLEDAQTISDVLRCVANEFFRALTHQDFGQMAIQEPRLLKGTFFQWLTWHPEGAHTVPTHAGHEAKELRVEQVSVVQFAEYLTAIPPGMVDVELTFFDTSRGIYASGVYRADLFTQATMDRFMLYLRSTAEDCLRNPDAPLGLASNG